MSRLAAFAVAMSCVGMTLPAQEKLPPPLVELIDRFRGTPRGAEHTKVRVEINRAFRSSSGFSATERTEFAGQLLALEWDPPIGASWPLGMLREAPDPERAAMHLLRFTDRQLALEKRQKAELDELLDLELVDLFGPRPPYVIQDKTYPRLDFVQCDPSREALVESLIAVDHEDTTRALGKLAAGVARPEDAAPVLEELFARNSLTTLDGLISWIDRRAKHYEHLEDQVAESKRRKARPVPEGEHRSDWMKKEKALTRNIIALYQRRANEQEKLLEGFVKRLRTVAKERDWPNAPRSARPIAKWQKWRAKVAKSLDSDG